LSLAAGIVINLWLSSSYLGFIIIGGFYLLLLVLIIIFKNKLKIIVSNFLRLLLIIWTQCFKFNPVSEKKGLLNFLKLDSIIENLSGYVENKLEILKIELKEDGAYLASRLILLIFLCTLAFVILLFLSLAAGIVINLWLSSSYLGFIIIGGFYLLLLVLIIIFKNKLKIESKIQSYLLRILK